MVGIEDILRRIGTFTFYNWNVKYKQLSPYKCALHGFINSGKHSLQCEICSETLTIEDSINDTSDPDKTSDLVAYYKKQLIINHAEECFFKNREYPSKITVEYLYQEWRTIYNNNLYTYGKQDNIELPVLTSQIREYIGESNLNIINLKQSIIKSDLADLPKILAIFGWKFQKPNRLIERSSDTPCLTCDFCGRNLLISAYKTKIGRVQNLADTPPQAVDSVKKEFVPILDPLREHKYFCKWGNPFQKDPNKQAGWSICVEMLRYTAITEGKELKEIPKETEENKAQGNIEQERAQQSIIVEQTKFKLEILDKMQQLKDMKEKTFKKYDDIIKSSERLGLQDSQRYTELLEGRRKNIDELIEELDLKVDPQKKVKI